MTDGWWTPDPQDRTKRHRWEPVDLKRSGLSEVILLRSDGAMRRILHLGSAVLAWPLPPDETEIPPRPVGVCQAVIPEGETRYVQLPDPEPAWSIL